MNRLLNESCTMFINNIDDRYEYNFSILLKYVQSYRSISVSNRTVKSYVKTYHMCLKHSSKVSDATTNEDQNEQIKKYDEHCHSS